MEEQNTVLEEETPSTEVSDEEYVDETEYEGESDDQEEPEQEDGPEQEDDAEIEYDDDGNVVEHVAEESEDAPAHEAVQDAPTDSTETVEKGVERVEEDAPRLRAELDALRKQTSETLKKLGVETDDPAFTCLWSASLEPRINISGKLLAGKQIAPFLNTYVFVENAVVIVTMTGTYTSWDDAINSGQTDTSPPVLEIMKLDGTSHIVYLSGETVFVVENVSGIITDFKLTCGTYDVDFGREFTVNISVTDQRLVRQPTPIKDIVLYEDEDCTTMARKYTIPDEILALPYYGFGFSETVYNYIDFDSETYVQMCDDSHALDVPVTTDISAYLTDFGGAVEINGAKRISFEEGDEKLMHFPIPFRYMYQSTV